MRYSALPPLKTGVGQKGQGERIHSDHLLGVGSNVNNGDADVTSPIE